jgi:hypothetical protein
MTEECAIRGCHKPSVHVAKVVARDGNPYSGPLLKEEVLKRLAAGESVPLCPDHYIWTVQGTSALVKA